MLEAVKSVIQGVLNEELLFYSAFGFLIFLIFGVAKFYLLGDSPNPSTLSPIAPRHSNSSEKDAANKPKKYFTAKDVAPHNKHEDCWLIIDGKVYDLTSYVDKHVGGDAILRNAGKDSSKGFHGDQHPKKVHELLWEFYIGDLKTK